MLRLQPQHQENLTVGVEYEIWLRLDDSTSPMFAVKFALRK